MNNTIKKGLIKVLEQGLTYLRSTLPQEIEEDVVPLKDSVESSTITTTEIVYEKPLFDYDQFIKEYDCNKNLKFDDMKFRPQASRTTGFGIDSSTQHTDLRIHNAIDSGISSTTGYQIFAPMDIRNSTYVNDEKYAQSFGAFIRMFTYYDFELRLMHIPMENVEVKLGDHAIAKDTYIADCGEIGKSFGRHLHFEIVSNTHTSKILDKILVQKYGDVVNVEYSQDDIRKQAIDYNIDLDIANDLYQHQRGSKSVSFLNSYKCLRTDYHTGDVKTFYSSMALFGM